MKTSTLFRANKLFILSILLLIVLKNAHGQAVSPLQTGHYLPAFSNIRDMAMPPPGFFILWYNYYSTTDTYYDRDGNKLSNLSLDQIDPSLPNVNFEINLDGFATAPAFFWAANQTILGGARYMAGVVPVYFWADASVLTEQRGGIADTTITDLTSGKLSGISDTYVAPLGLSWGLKKLDLTLFYGFTAPTGKYESGADDNIGLGFWTHQVQGFGTFYPVEDQSTALMLGLTYELNGKIKGEDFNPGNRLSLEWGISQYVSDRIEVGIQGGHNWQTTDDKGTDVFWDPTVHDKKSTLAFNAGYWAWQERLQLTLKYGFDFGMIQRFKNNMFMLNFVFLTNALTGGSPDN